EHRALHYAVLDNNPEMVRVLMEQGADPFEGIWPHRSATSALTIATDRGYDQIVAIINEALQRRSVEEAARRPNRAAEATTIDMSAPVMARLIPAMTDGNDEATVLSCL